MIDLADTAVLVEAVEQGSLSAAGRRLGIAPMAASRRLAALEAELGVRLVNRTTRSLSLTPEGEAFLPHARAMLAHAADARAAVSPAEAGVFGVLRIAASIPFGRKILTPVLAGFLRDHPRLRAELRLSDGIVDIAGQGIDVAFRIAALADSNLVARRLADNRRALYAAPPYLARAGHPVVLADLAGHACIVTDGTTHWTFQRNGRSVRQPIAGRFAADSVEALHQAALEGLGIALLSDWNLRDDVAAGRLIEIPLADAALEDQGIWAVMPSRQFVPARVRLFLDTLDAHLRRH